MKYSFIVPVYNCSNHLSDCINSIVAQNCEDYELILIDDGSTDGSAQICETFADRYENIFLYHKNNGGVSSARNMGIRVSHGHFLLFVDADDTISPNLIRDFEDQVGNETPLFIYGMSFAYYQKNKMIREEPVAYPIDGEFAVGELGDHLEDFFRCNSLSSACNKIFLKKIITDNNLSFKETMRIYEDFDFVLRYLQYILKFRNSSETYYHYRLDANETHYHQRISDIGSLLNSLEQLKRSLIDLEKRFYKSDAGKCLYQQLCLQLAYSHLIYSDNLKKSVGALTDYWYQDALLMREEVEKCGNAYFLRLLQKGNKCGLVMWIRWKRLVRIIKKGIKLLYRKNLISVRKSCY